MRPRLAWAIVSNSVSKRVTGAAGALQVTARFVCRAAGDGGAAVAVAEQQAARRGRARAGRDPGHRTPCLPGCTAEAAGPGGGSSH